MGEIKELEEARAIFDLVYAGLHGGRQPHHSLFNNFMKNLKGDGWSIAIITTTNLSILLENIPVVVTPEIDGVQRLAQVIWQAGE